MQTIAVNTRSLSSNLTGVQRYTSEVLAQLGTKAATISPKNRQGRLTGHIWEQLALPVLLRSRFLWSPSNTGPLLVSRQVVTIHDVSVLDHPEWFENKFAAWYNFLLPKLASRVKHILTDSNFSKSRLLAHLPIGADKITVVYPAVDVRFHPVDQASLKEFRGRLKLPDRYVLFVGSLDPRKNLGNLLDAWKIINSRRQDITLLVAGADGHVFRQTRQPAELANTQFLGYVSDSDLPMLYNCAEAFIYPSIYEGFGLPVLEAMACGTPVLTTRRTSIPEVGGECVLYIEPEQPESMAAAVEDLLDNPHLKKDLAAAGLEHRQKFQWEQTAAEIWRLLEKYANE